MIDDAHQASEALRDSSLAHVLKSHGFTMAAMAKEANAMTDLHTRVQMAKAALAEATGALQSKAREFGQFWSSYSNLVRALTKDLPLRTKHGVATPGLTKNPRHRGPAKASTTVPNVEAPAIAHPWSNGNDTIDQNGTSPS